MLAGSQHRADDRGIDEHRHTQAHAELLPENIPPKGKAAEDTHHDGGRAGDLPCGQPDSLGHGRVISVALIVGLFDPVQQQHVVVHGEAEQDGKEHHRQPRRDDPRGVRT